SGCATSRWATSSTRTTTARPSKACLPHAAPPWWRASKKRRPLGRLNTPAARSCRRAGVVTSVLGHLAGLLLRHALTLGNGLSLVAVQALLVFAEGLPELLGALRTALGIDTGAA